jgi:hypothetical protein
VTICAAELRVAAMLAMEPIGRDPVKFSRLSSHCGAL